MAAYATMPVTAGFGGTLSTEEQVALSEAAADYALEEQLRLVWPDNVYPTDLSLAFTFAHLPNSVNSLSTPAGIATVSPGSLPNQHLAEQEQQQLNIRSVSPTSAISISPKQLLLSSQHTSIVPTYSSIENDSQLQLQRQQSAVSVSTPRGSQSSAMTATTSAASPLFYAASPSISVTADTTILPPETLSAQQQQQTAATPQMQLAVPTTPRVSLVTGNAYSPLTSSTAPTFGYRLSVSSTAETWPGVEYQGAVLDHSSDNDSVDSPYLDASALTPPGPYTVLPPSAAVAAIGACMANFALMGCAPVPLPSPMPVKREPSSPMSISRQKRESLIAPAAMVHHMAGTVAGPRPLLSNQLSPASAAAAYKRTRTISMDSAAMTEGGGEDGERKELKRMKNREAAARCRFRRKKLIEDLQQQADALISENDLLRQELERLTTRIHELEQPTPN